MNCVVTIVFRFLQTIGLLAILTGLGNVPEAVERFDAARNGEAWRIGDLAGAFAKVSGPVAIGLLFLVGFEAVLRMFKSLQARIDAHPNEPWLWQRDWAEKHIRLSNRGAAMFLCIAWAVFLLVIVPIGLAMADIKLSNGIYGFLGVFALILYAFGRYLWTNRQWNRSELRLATLPGVIGGPFAGVAILHERLPAGTPLRVIIKCERITRRSSRNSGGSTFTETLWQSQKIFDRFIDPGVPGAIGLPFSFAIPFDCEPSKGVADSPSGWTVSTGNRTNRQIRWSLVIAPKQSGDFRKAEFHIPVFRTAASVPDYRDDESAVAPFMEKPVAEDLLAKLPHRIEPIPGGTRIVFHSFEWRGFVATILFVLATSAALWALCIYAITPVALFFGLIPLALTGIGLWGLFEMLTWQARLDVHADAIEVEAGHRGFRKRFNLIRGGKQLECAEDFRKEMGAWWRIQVDRGREGKVSIVRRLDGQQDAEAVRDWLVKLIEEKTKEAQ